MATQRRCPGPMVSLGARPGIPRLQNHNSTNDGNVDFRSFRVAGLGNLCKIVDLLA